MKTVFEVISQQVLPAMRSLIAKCMIENGFSQKQIADKLDLSQPAISQYKRDLRGHKTGIFVDYPQLLEDANAIAKQVADGDMEMSQATTQLFETCQQLMQDR